jgi:hypothetical protein
VIFKKALEVALILPQTSYQQRKKYMFNSDGRTDQYTTRGYQASNSLPIYLSIL